MDGGGDSDGGGGDGGLEEEPERERDGVEREEDGEASALVIVAHARSRDMMSHKGDKSQLRPAVRKCSTAIFTLRREVLLCRQKCAAAVPVQSADGGYN